MEAINFTAKTQKLELRSVPLPKIAKPDQVLIKVAYAGICGTDLHIIQVCKKIYILEVLVLNKKISMYDFVEQFFKLHLHGIIVVTPT